MRGFSCALLSVAVCVSLSSCVTTQGSHLHAQNGITAVSGERTKIAQAWHLNPDCTADGVPNIRILQEPQHGSVNVVTEPVYPLFARGVLAKCRTKKVRGTVVYYTSAPHYLGPDRVRTRSSFQMGGVADVVTKINVVK